MSKRTDSIITLLLLFAIVIVASNAFFAFHAERVLVESEAAVIATWEAINTVERTLNDVESVETGARGYLLSDNPSYLTPYYTGLRALPRDMDHFREVTAGNPRQQARAEELRRAVQSRTDLLQMQIGLEQSGRRDAAQTLVHEGVGQAQMDRLRGVVSSMQLAETQELARRESDSVRAHTEARFTIGLASALDLLLILASGIWLSRERRLRAEANWTAERLTRLQNIIDAGISNLEIAALRLEMLTRLCSVARADAAAIYSYVDEDAAPGQRTQARVDASVGVDLAAGTTFRLRPDGPLARAGDANEVVKLSGEAVQELPIGEFSHSMETLLILPLRASENHIGLIVLGRRKESSFSAEDEELLRIAADRIALSIDRARLFAEESAARKTAENATQEVRVLNAELEERVRQRTLELETTNRELEAFAYSVSHDLRAPLRSVDGFSLALAEDYGAVLEGDGQHYLNRIRVGVQRMGSLIDALLQLSRITRAEISLEDVDLSAIAESVADDLRQANPERPVAFGIEPGLRAKADSRLMHVVLTNMFGNAVKFTGRAESPRIEFGWSPEQRAYFIRDNGAGFDQQYAGKLFVAFQRLHGDRDFQGSGIGLATVARVIHRHHGTIRAQGEVGKGATFWFTLG